MMTDNFQGGLSVADRPEFVRYTINPDDTAPRVKANAFGVMEAKKFDPERMISAIRNDSKTGDAFSKNLIKVLNSRGVFSHGIDGEQQIAQAMQAAIYIDPNIATVSMKSNSAKFNAAFPNQGSGNIGISLSDTQIAEPGIIRDYVRTLASGKYMPTAGVGTFFHDRIIQAATNGRGNWQPFPGEQNPPTGSFSPQYNARDQVRFASMIAIDDFTQGRYALNQFGINPRTELMIYAEQAREALFERITQNGYSNGSLVIYGWNDPNLNPALTAAPGASGKQDFTYNQPAEIAAQMLRCAMAIVTRTGLKVQLMDGTKWVYVVPARYQTIFGLVATAFPIQMTNLQSLLDGYHGVGNWEVHFDPYCDGYSSGNDQIRCFVKKFNDGVSTDNGLVAKVWQSTRLLMGKVFPQGEKTYQNMYCATGGAIFWRARVIQTMNVAVNA